MGKINCIGILTSGGDAPGMNAAIRAVTRAGIAAGLKVKGIYRGYEGLINNEIQDFTTGECEQYHPKRRNDSEDGSQQGISYAGGA